MKSLPLLAALTCVFQIGTAQEKVSDVVFLENGEQKQIAEASGEWNLVDEFLEAEGAGSKLIAGQQIGPGDFSVRAELALEKMDRSAAVFKMGSSYFGFAGGHGKIFLTGALFDDAKGTPIGDPTDFMTDGEVFVLDVIREGEQLRFLIDGKAVHERKVHAKAIGEFGLMPGRAKLRVKNLSAKGNLADQFEIPLDPPYRVKTVPGVEKNRLLAPSPGNARNSEGDFIELKDGRILFVYTHFTGGGSDHAAGHLAGRFSSDRGVTWTKEDVVIVPQSGGFNDMSVSLLRLQNGNIALFYARKNSTLDCRPVMRISTDEAKSWSDTIEVITDEIGYYVLNNDRVIQLKDGRLIMAVALHNSEAHEKPNWDGHVMCYYSEDSGKTWKRNTTILAPERDNGTRLIAQEPGLIELKDGRLMMFIRSNAGAQLFSYSEDRGETWSKPKVSTLKSPVSPATIERIPTTGDLLVAWNNHENIDESLKGKRTPFAVAISKNEGETWTHVRTLEDDPNGWYCYTAMDFVGEHVLLGHCAGDRRKGGLNLTQITRFPVELLYAPVAEAADDLAKVRKKLETGAPAKVVCFGDSVTGLYYHTGGRRTYTDMLGIALKQIYPKAEVEMINAGISGHTTENALARIDKDVLSHKPDLVTVMFGLNDMVKVPIGKYEANLRSIAGQIRAAGAGVVFSTPNAVTTTENRPVEKLVQYCEVVRRVAAEKNIPLSDSFSEFEKMRKVDPEAWRLTMSDEIHPNMGGHKEIAVQLAETISGKATSLEKIGPPQPALLKTGEVVAAKKTLKVLAMSSLSEWIEPALKTKFPGAEIEMTNWEAAGKTLPELRKEASHLVRKMKPDLVLLTVPRSATAANREAFIDSLYWMTNFSLSFGRAEWDCVVIHPSVMDSEKGENDDLIRKLTANHDLSLIDRKVDDKRAAGEIILEWVKAP